MDIKAVRRENMKVLIKGMKNQSAFAKKMGTTSSYISQCLKETAPEGKKNKNGIGTKIARKVEQVFDLPHGWMDTDRTKQTGISLPVLSDSDLAQGIPVGLSSDQTFMTVERVGSRAFAYRLQEDGMSGLIDPDSMVVVDPDGNIEAGNPIMVANRNGIFVRLLVNGTSGKMLKPFNTVYQPSPLSEDFCVIGVVREAIKRTTFAEH